MALSLKFTDGRQVELPTTTNYSNAANNFRFARYYTEISPILGKLTVEELGQILAASRKISDQVKNLGDGQSVTLQAAGTSIVLTRGAKNDKKMPQDGVFEADMANYVSRFIAAVGAKLAQTTNPKTGENIINSFAYANGIRFQELKDSVGDEQKKNLLYRLYVLDNIGLKHIISHPKLQDYGVALFLYRYKQAKDGNSSNSAITARNLELDAETIRVSNGTVLADWISKEENLETTKLAMELLSGLKARKARTANGAGQRALATAMKNMALEDDF